MDRKTLTGFILIGAILLLWPSYLELISPSEKNDKDVVSPDTSLVEKYSEPILKKPKKFYASKQKERKVINTQIKIC